MLHDIITNSNRYKVALEVVHDMRQGWQEIKGCHSIDDYLVWIFFIAMIVSKSIDTFIAIGDIVGANPWVLNRSSQRRLAFVERLRIEWAFGKTKKEKKKALLKYVQVVLLQH